MDLTEGHLEKKFNEIGEVEHVKILRDPTTGMTWGFGFVKFKRSEDAKKAVDKLHESEFDGKWIIVEISKRDAPRPKTPGRYLGVTRTSRDWRYGNYWDRRDWRDDYNRYSRDNWRDYWDSNRYNRDRWDHWEYDRYNRDRRDRKYSKSD